MGLSKYVIKAQEILDHHKGVNDMSVPRAWNKKPTVFCAPDRGSVIPSLSGDLLVNAGPFLGATRPEVYIPPTSGTIFLIMQHNDYSIDASLSSF
jgi:hypothetical protein